MSDEVQEMLTLPAFEQAAHKVREVTQETKLIESPHFSEIAGNRVFFKPENMQRTGAYKVTGLTPMVVGPGINTGLNIQMDNPASVGSDLIVAAVAALQEYTAPLMLIDMGTATTITVVYQGNNYIGGAIIPGVRVSAEALSSRAAQLPGIQLDRPKRAIGKNTIECMRSGIMYGAAAMLDGMVERMEAELGKPVTVVATGGIAQFVVPLCKREIKLEKNLLLKGLNLLYKKNKKG